jgi:hypothetical protein
MIFCFVGGDAPPRAGTVYFTLNRPSIFQLCFITRTFLPRTNYSKLVRHRVDIVCAIFFRIPRSASFFLHRNGLTLRLHPDQCDQKGRNLTIWEKIIITCVFVTMDFCQVLEWFKEILHIFLQISGNFLNFLAFFQNISGHTDPDSPPFKGGSAKTISFPKDRPHLFTQALLSILPTYVHFVRENKIERWKVFCTYPGGMVQWSLSPPQEQKIRGSNPARI